MYYIFDLDETVICSKHRKNTLPDGSLDLKHWIEHNTAEKIAKDSLLPLAKTMRSTYFSGEHIVIVCTARVLSEADYEFFMIHNLPYHHMLDRPLGCNMADHELKDIQLRLFAHGLGISWAEFSFNAIIYDDNRKVLERCQNIGITALNAIGINKALAK
jgi:hypothetical protein